MYFSKFLGNELDGEEGEELVDELDNDDCDDFLLRLRDFEWDDDIYSIYP